MNVKNVIIGASDENCGDFLANHWLRSLVENVNLRNVDIVILDYGLNSAQVATILKAKNTKVIKCKKDGNIGNIRLRDILALLKKSNYDQVMSCDGGDIIFQRDISNLFRENKTAYRAVSEEHGFPFNELIIAFQRSIKQEMQQEIKKYIQGKKGINAGVIVAPKKKFMRFCELCNDAIADKSKFGPEQLVMNYLFYKEGYVELDRTYNFFPYAANDRFTVKEGRFYDGSGQLIAIVHNAGADQWKRVIRNFGYGKEHNQVSYLRYYIVRFLLRISGWIHPLER